MGLISNLPYSNPSAVAERNNLIHNKNWIFSGDKFEQNCETRLATAEIFEIKSFAVFQNPVTDYLKHQDQIKYRLSKYCRYFWTSSFNNK